MDTRVARLVAAGAGAAFVSLVLTGCSSPPPETIDTAYGVGTPVYWIDDMVGAIRFPDGSVGVPQENGKGLAFVNHPSGEITVYEEDGTTINSTIISKDGASLASGVTTSKDAMATMGSEFLYASEDGATVVSGVPLGVYASSPTTEGDPGRCLLVYFSFQVGTLSDVSAPFEASVFSPQPDYVVNGEEVFQHELDPVFDKTRFGLCDAGWMLEGSWAPDFSIVDTGVTYHSAQSVYVPEDVSFDGIIVGYWEGRRVYYAPTYLAEPPPTKVAPSVAPQQGHAAGTVTRDAGSASHTF